jgi:hypothetical protein
MESRNLAPNPALPPPPGAIGALVGGFNAITGNIAVILIPILFDTFLWLGPRLASSIFFEPMREILPQVQAQLPAGQVQPLVDFFTEFSNGFNLFSVLRTFPLGVFSLMSANLSLTSPLGLRPAYEIPNLLIFLGLMLCLTVGGWLAGVLYFQTVARAALGQEKAAGLPWAFLQSLILAAFWSFLFLLANLPLVIFFFLLSLLNGLVVSVILFILILPLTWLAMGIFFSFHGIFASRQNLFISVRNSARLLRYGLPPLGWFSMLALVISQGLNLLWKIPPVDSWLAGIGIIGHAFVSTSLLAASFIYYRDLNAWVESALDWLKSQKTTSSARA